VMASIASLAEQGGASSSGASTAVSLRRTVDLASGTSVALELPVLPVAPGVSYTLRVVATAPAIPASPAVLSLPVAVDRAVTVTSVLPSASPVAVGQRVTYMVGLSVSLAGLPAATGTVAFDDDGSPIVACAARPVSRAQATCSVSYPAAGTHAITAGYGASVGNFTGGSGSVEEVVRPATAGTDRMASVAVRPAGAGLTRGGLRAAMHRSVASGPASVNDLALMSLLDESSG